MKQLTVIATIFLPLSFITGFFGQNFSYMVTHLINTTWTFWVIGVGSMAVTVVGLLVYFRRKGWGRSRSRGVGPEAPQVALGIAGAVERAVLRILRRGGDLGAGLDRVPVVAFEVLDDNVGPPLSGAAVVVLAPPRAEHHEPVAIAEPAWATVPSGPLWTTWRLKPNARSSQSIAAGASR